MGRHWLVTGGSGFIGSGLVRRLVKRGDQVRVLDDLSRGRQRRLSDVAGDVDFRHGDVRDPAAVADATEGVDAVCHLAYVNGTELFYSQPELVLDVAVRGMLNVLDACRRHSVGELVLASSSEVYQTPARVPTDESAALVVPDVLNPRYSYGGGKIISELMAVNFGRRLLDRVVIFRPHNVFGPDMGWEHVIPQFARRMAESVQQQPSDRIRFPIQGRGDETRTFIFIDDFIDGLELVIDRGEHLGIYHIGTMDERSIRSVAVEVGRCFDREVDIVPGPLTAGSTLRRCPDIAKLRALGFNPRHPFPSGLRETVRWYAEHLAEAPQKLETA